MKLTNTQTVLMHEAKMRVKIARESKTYEEYMTHYSNMWDMEKTWEQERNGIVNVKSNANTLKALEKMGLIEIISSCNHAAAIYLIKVID